MCARHEGREKQKKKRKVFYDLAIYDEAMPSVMCMCIRAARAAL